MTIDQGGKTGRRSGPGSSKQAILDAAREHFTRFGYRGATLRAIAAQAGGDPALVRHFFGSKDGLFAAAMELPTEAAQVVLDVFDAPAEQWGERLSRAYLSLWEDPLTAAPLRATLVSAFSNDEALDRLRAFLTAGVVAHIRPLLPADDPDVRMAVAMTHLLGIAMARHLVEVPSMTTYDLDDLVALVGPTVQRYLTGPLPARAAPGTGP